MEVLSDPPAAAALLNDSWRALAQRGEVRRYPKNVLLIQEGDHGDTLFIILSGSVKAFSSDDRDREITYGTYGAGECIGEMTLDGGPRSASVITLEATRCAVVTRQRLREHIRANPEFAFEIIDRVIGRARRLTENARGLALLDVYGRLARVLNAMAVVDPHGRRAIAPRPTHQELANRTGASREMVGKLLKDLLQGGYMRADGRSVWVIERALPSSW